MNMKIINIVGARPNFIKIAPIMRQMRKSQIIEPVLLHTGQHYDIEMSKRFFQELNIPSPDISLEVGSDKYLRRNVIIIDSLQDRINNNSFPVHSR